MRRRFSLHHRGDVDYCRLRNPQTGRRTSAKSTGAADRDEAAAVADRWLREGVPTGRRRELRPVATAFTLEAALAYLRTGPVTADDTARILAVLQGAWPR